MSRNLAERTVGWISRWARQRQPYQASNIYLEGPFAPAHDEVTETQLRITGELPRELNGLYARIGPNPTHVDNPGLYHWFAGDGMVHGLRLAEGQALWYRNRWIGSNSVRRAQGKPMAPGPRRGVSDVVNTNVFGHAGRVWASVEAGMLPVQLDDQLETVRHGYFDSEVSRAFSAHPHRDPDTGSLHAVCYDALDQRRVHHVEIDATGRVARLVDIPVSHGPMVHDCAITRSQVVVLDLPVTFSLGRVLRGNSMPYAWNDRHAARVGLLPLKGDTSSRDIRWFNVEPCFVFHTCNAQDTADGGVLLDVVVHHRMFDRSSVGPETDQQRITFERWTLSPHRSDVVREVVAEGQQEFPRFDERLTGRSYRHAYTVGFSFDFAKQQQLHAYDLGTGRHAVHNFGLGRVPGEAVFVPRTPDAAENDGWLVCYVSDMNTGLSDFVVLNAADVAGPPQAVVHLPARVPLGFHGNWIPDPA